MKLDKADLDILRWPLTALVASVLAGALLVGAGYVFFESAQKQNKISQAQRGESQGKLARAAQEEQELRQKIERFLVLEKQGFVGTEDRLGWIEQIGRLAREHKLYEFRYEFQPQRPADAVLLPQGSVAGSHAFLQSTQRFSTKVLHEADLTAFIAALRTQLPAFIVVRDCRLARTAPDPVETRIAPKLSAECDLDWIKLSPTSK